MTPCEEKGYKVGDEFVVSNPRASKVHRKGVKVRLCKDDGTASPYFEPVFKKDRDGIPRWAFDLGEVSPFSEHDIITRTNGQPFATESSARQQLTAKGLQGTHEVAPHEGGYALAPINRDDGPITLRPVDYVSTEGMTEDQYHAVARAFIGAGFESGEYPRKEELKGERAFGVDARRGSLFHGRPGSDGDHVSALCGRHLTIEQVLGATNAGTTTPQPEEATMPTDPITTLKQARATRDEAEQAYQQALADAREYLGEGFMLAEAGVDWAAPDEDMTDPSNWREGDFVKCVYPNYQGYKEGGLYEVFAPLNGGRIGVIGDFEYQQEMRRAENFRFHHRPS